MGGKQSIIVQYFFLLLKIGSRGFRKWLDHKDGALKIGIGAFTIEITERVSNFLPREAAVRRGLRGSGHLSIIIKSTNIFMLASPAFRIWRN